MMRSNEFRGATLAEAVGKATAVYRRGHGCEMKNQRSCNDLLREIASLQQSLGQTADEAQRLEGDAERLRRDAYVELGLAALTALSTVSGALRGLRVVIRRLKAKRPGKLTADDIGDLLAMLGPLGAAYGALRAATKIREAETLARHAELLERGVEQVARELNSAVREYERPGCGESRPRIS